MFSVCFSKLQHLPEFFWVSRPHTAFSTSQTQSYSWSSASLQHTGHGQSNGTLTFKYSHSNSLHTIPIAYTILVKQQSSVQQRKKWTVKFTIYSSIVSTSTPIFFFFKWNFVVSGFVKYIHAQSFVKYIHIHVCGCFKVSLADGMPQQIASNLQCPISLQLMANK